MGYLGAPVAEEYGGRGLDYVTYALIVEQIGRVDSAARTVVSVQTSLVCGSIERWGTEEQKQRWLPRLCCGERFGCFGLTEPDAGSDAGQPAHPGREDRRRLAHQRPQDVDLDRQRRRASRSSSPRPTREKAHRGLACFLVPTSTAASPRQEIHGKLGLRASDTAAIALRRRRVADDALLGEVGDGFKIAMSALDRGRYSVAAGCVGICHGCVDASVAYATEREQFGAPIASFQLVQAMIAEMIVKRDAARLLVLRAGLLKDARPAEHDRDVDREALRDRGRGASAPTRHPGPRRLRLRRRPPGRALPPRRPGHDALRGHVADPQADHRPRRHRHRRDPPVRARERRRSPMSGPIDVAVDRRVAVCTIADEAHRNSLGPELAGILITALEDLDRDDAVGAIVITGSGDYFATGPDLRAFAGPGQGPRRRHRDGVLLGPAAGDRQAADRGGERLGALDRL